MSVFLHGFRINGYRSLSSDSYIGPFSKLNLFVGINNSGKSNILQFIRIHLSRFIESALNKRGNAELTGDDKTRGSSGLTFSLGTPDIGFADKTISNLISSTPLSYSFDGKLAEFVKLPSITRTSELFWIDFDVLPSNGNIPNISDAQLTSVVKEAGSNANQLHNILISQYDTREARSNFQSLVRNIIEGALKKVKKLPTVSLIPTHRQITAPTDADHVNRIGHENDEDIAGKGLIERLFMMMNPTNDRFDDYTPRLARINAFLQEITDEKNALIRIPHNKSRVEVQMSPNAKPYGLADLGAGIHQIIIIAAAATAYSKRIICIEEPETNLHPILQRKLLAYLQNETDNQYFISTHSAHIIDMGYANTFRVTKIDDATHVNRVMSPSDRWVTCFDLGYKASDLVQSNCILWVEGPSDRLYLKHWLQLLDTLLIEGVHYSVMHYGGSLRAHVTASDEPLDDLVKLRSMNRNLIFVADSDKKKESNEITKTLARIKEEITKEGGIAWVTKGREMENYLDATIVNKVIAGSSFNEVKQTPYGDMVPTNENGSEISKIDLAEKYLAESKDTIPDVLDLKERLAEVLQFIKKSNS